MPIKGLTEQRRLPRIDKIRLGVKKISEKSGKEYPSATEYFVIPDSLKPYIKDEHPTCLQIMFPVEDDEIICQQYYKRYSGERGLTCKGDGETCRRMVDKATGEIAHHNSKDVAWVLNAPCTGRECTEYLAKPQACKEVMNLQFIMPDIPGLGVWQIDTSSINSIRNINNAIAMIRAVYKRIAFIPLLLTLEPAEVINPDDGKKKVVHVLNLRIKESMKALMSQAMQPMAQLMCPAPAEDEAPLDESFFESEPENTAPPPVKQEIAKSPEIKPSEKPRAAKPKEKPMTKADVDNAPPLTDEDFNTPSDSLPQEQVNPATIEGTDAWIILKICKLNISDKGILEHINRAYHIPIEPLPVSNTLAKLTDDNRKDLTKLIKAKEKQMATAGSGNK